ncbi:MAG: class I SAM-dependent methyltransferase [Sulfurifustis sp.]
MSPGCSEAESGLQLLSSGIGIEWVAMSCCCPHSRSGSRLFSRLARRYRRRFEKKGLEASERQLVEGIERAGLANVSLLEIGSGVGYLNQYLLKRGAATAVGVDLAPKMVEEAEALARKNGFAERTRYHVGDFVESAETFDSADVAILDKVICCYPDVERMVKTSVAKARRVYAYTIPRDRWYTRFFTALIDVMLRVIGSNFQSYVHDPKQIEAWVTAAGLTKHYENHTFIWLTRVYARG